MTPPLLPQRDRLTGDNPAASSAARRWGRWGLILYGLCTLAAGLHLGIVFSLPEDAVQRWAAEGPYSKAWVTAISVTAVWLLLGSVLVLLERGVLGGRWLLSILLFYLVALLYATFLRERTFFGDAWDYSNAAFDIYHGKPFQRYTYLPFWACCLRLFVGLGRTGVVGVCVASALLSLMALYWLLVGLLRRFGFSPNLAGLCAALALLVCVPAQRTLFYGQVNFMVIDLILVMILTASRWPILSAAALAAAVHVKMSPIVFVLPMLVSRQVKWLVAFAAALAAIVGLTFLAGGGPEYYEQVSRSLGSIHTANLPSDRFRDFSIDSLFLVAGDLARADPAWIHAAMLSVKALVVLALLGLVWRAGRRKPFWADSAGLGHLYNMTPPLLVLMVMTSPLVWPHHLVFLLPTLVLLAPHLVTPGRRFAFGAAIFFLLLLPVFDVYPLGHGRLIGVGIICWLIYAADFARGKSTLDAMNRWADRRSG